MVKILIQSDGIHIEDSYLIKKVKIMNKSLKEFRKSYPELSIWNRSIYSLVCEWLVHNFLYSLGLWKVHTKDVDLEYPQKGLNKLIYLVVGTFLYPFHI